MPTSTSVVFTSKGQENGDREEKHVWSSLLDEVAHKAAVTLSPSKTLIVLGDDECGKTTLIARLQGTEDPKKGFGLEYFLLGIKDEDRDDQTNLNVWILDGNPIHSHLLKFAINEESFGDCYIMICVSMARPWDIVDNLKKWASILEEHIRRLSIPEENICEYKTSVFHHFCNYLEPDVTPSLSTVHQSDALPVDMHRKLYKMHPASAFLLSNTLDSSTPPAKDVEPVNITVKSSRDGNTLCNNLGVPLVVVVTKTDTMSTLEKEHQLTEEHFDFIQMHVRRFCLSYGAALFYVSVKEDKNCDLLNRYLQSRIYGFPFTQTAYVVERDCIFVPAGWDSEKKIGILQENLAQIQPLSPYSDIVPPPPSNKAAVREPEALAQDEQIFLTRLMVNMQRDIAQTNISNTSVCGPSDSVMDQLAAATGLTNSPQGVGSRPVSGSPRTHGSGSRSKPVSTVGGTGVTTGNPGPGASEGVLANFFNSLLSKRPPVVGGAAGINTSASTTTQSSLERAPITQKDIQSELERLARSSREALDTGENGTEQLISNDIRQQKLDEMKSYQSTDTSLVKSNNNTTQQGEV